MSARDDPSDPQPHLSLKVPESMQPPNELTQQQKRDLHQALSQKEQALLSSIAAQSENSAPVAPDASLGRLTRLDAIQQQQMAKAQLAKAKRDLHKVQQILSSWDDEKAGQCRSCEEPIGYERLKRVPDSLICMECLEDAR